MSGSALAPAVLTIDLGALAANYRLFKSMTTAEVAGVIKANGYGLGATEVFKTLRGEGCRRFFVATPDEAIALPAASEDHVYVLGGLYHGVEEMYRDKNIIPVLNSADDIRRWSAFAQKRGEKLPAILHIDTGMNRLGAPADIDPEACAAFDLHFVMSHFSSSDEKDHAANDRQAESFAAVAARFPHAKKSLANSSGLFRKSAWHYDLIRPGYALYGGNPLPETVNPVKAVVDLKIRVLQTRTIKKGEHAGYNETYRFDKDTTCATVATGYADGFPRSLSNKGVLYWNGQPCPIRGRVSMDLTIIETGHLPNPPKQGDWVEVLGPHQDVDTLAAAADTIGYNILTALGPRYHRIYVRE